MTAEKKNFRVILQITEDHEYTILANTSEEAEVIADQMFEDGDEGNMGFSDYEITDSYPVEDSEDE